MPGQGFRHKSSRFSLAKEFSPKINELQAMFFDDGRARDAQTSVAPPKHLLFDFTPVFFGKKIAKKNWGVEK